jgi:hypothetical protein
LPQLCGLIILSKGNNSNFIKKRYCWHFDFYYG